MDKTKMGMLGAVTALAALPVGAQAATTTEPAVAPAQSFADLLQPIPNAVERLQASNRELASGFHLMQAQYSHHHHHSHSHNAAWWRDYYRRLYWQRHHRSHHHHNNYNYGNNHHHNNYNNGNNHHHNNYNNGNNHNHHHNNPY